MDDTEYYNKVLEEISKREKLLAELMIEYDELKNRVETLSFKALPRFFRAIELLQRETQIKELNIATEALMKRIKIADEDLERAKERI